jgi:hypothetical protein
MTPLTADVTLISKPSNLNVPPWQMVSALLGGASERSATWWASPQSYSAKKSIKFGRWNDKFTLKRKKPGDVIIAQSGPGVGRTLGLIGGQNHAKLGVITSAQGNTRFSAISTSRVRSIR